MQIRHIGHPGQMTALVYIDEVDSVIRARLAQKHFGRRQYADGVRYVGDAAAYAAFSQELREAEGTPEQDAAGARAAEDDRRCDEKMERRDA